MTNRDQMEMESKYMDMVCESHHVQEQKGRKVSRAYNTTKNYGEWSLYFYVRDDGLIDVEIDLTLDFDETSKPDMAKRMSEDEEFAKANIRAFFREWLLYASGMSVSLVEEGKDIKIEKMQQTEDYSYIKAVATFKADLGGIAQKMASRFQKYDV